MKEILHAVWERIRLTFKGNPFAWFGFSFAAVLVFVALFAPQLSPHPKNAMNLAKRDLPPSWEHWMGTDDLGRDVFSRVLFGARVSLTVGVVSQAVSLGVGIVLGMIAGFHRGWMDHLIMWLVNVVWAFPYLLLVLAIQIALPNQPWTIFLAIGLAGWVPVARIVRGEVLSLREREFVEAARSLGFSPLRIMFRHLLPNIAPTLIVVATLGLATAIIAEAALSFLGLGIQPPEPSWGNMIYSGYTKIGYAWWQALFPSLAIMLSVLAFNLLGDAFSTRRIDV